MTTASRNPKSSSLFAFASPQQEGAFQELHIPSGASSANEAASAAAANFPSSSLALNPGREAAVGACSGGTSS